MPTARDINQANDQAGKRVPATMKIIQEASGKAFMPEKCEPLVRSIIKLSDIRSADLICMINHSGVYLKVSQNEVGSAGVRFSVPYES